MSIGFNLRFLAACLVCGIVVASCAVQPDTLAVWDDGAVSVSDLDTHVLSLPAAARRPPAGQSFEEWAQEQIRRIAVQRILIVEGRPEASPDDPGVRARRLWNRTRALIAALDQDLMQQTSVSPDDVQAALDEVARPETNEPFLDFHHIFIRKDTHGPADARRRARAALEDLRTGTDFDEAARRHSESADAVTGGAVTHARASDLEAQAAATLGSLAEGQVSEVVETRTGLHVFRLDRRLSLEATTDDQFYNQVATRLRAKQAATEKQKLLERLHQDSTIRIDSWPWLIGEWSVVAEVAVSLLDKAAKGSTEDPEQTVVNQLLLADEARRRGLETNEIEAGLDHLEQAERARQRWADRWKSMIQEIPDAKLRTVYDAQPSRFSTEETAAVHLIFVRQGRDSFATQTHLEGQVAQLHSGDISFEALAMQISKGPFSDSGGDLGLLTPQQWMRLSPVMHGVISKLEVGTISDPIYLTDKILTRDPATLKGGFAVVKVSERHPPQTRGFDEAIDQVRAVYANKHRETLEVQLQNKILYGVGFELRRLPSADELSR